ncbi:hypothetical protein [Methylobacterium gossipiicola]|uniref:Phosphoribosyl transferase domain-containing protein n=1 Tax=Methylobacterium gossipiicola TaxID=582675 RepID=A0A1I2TK73_9HYPH|nr:hypothetical protein [Methylobacterium gossipiicola]SFG65268.1 hypothetical protein SAMN05192565_107168 [Methylobacterium gossipiicola]
MTTLVTHSFCKYLTSTGNWRDQDYRARIVVKSVKGDDFKGYWDRKIGDKIVRLDENNKEVTADLAASFMAARLKDLVNCSVTLVPIPNSNACVGGPRDFRTRLFADAIAKHAGDRVAVKSACLWKKPKEQQHKTDGYRHASQFIPLLEMVYKPKRPVILIDDMITSGSQMLACTYILRAAGVDVRFGMAVGRQTTEQEDGVLKWDEKEISQLIL